MPISPSLPPCRLVRDWLNAHNFTEKNYLDTSEAQEYQHNIRYIESTHPKLYAALLEIRKQDTAGLPSKKHRPKPFSQRVSHKKIKQLAQTPQDPLKKANALLQTLASKKTSIPTLAPKTSIPTLPPIEKSHTTEPHPQIEKNDTTELHPQCDTSKRINPSTLHTTSDTLLPSSNTSLQYPRRLLIPRKDSGSLPHTYLNPLHKARIHFPYRSCCTLEDILYILNQMISFLEGRDPFKKFKLASSLSYMPQKQCNVLQINLTETTHPSTRKEALAPLNRRHEILKQEATNPYTGTPVAYYPHTIYHTSSCLNTQIVLQSLLNEIRLDISKLPLETYHKDIIASCAFQVTEEGKITVTEQFSSSLSEFKSLHYFLKTYQSYLSYSNTESSQSSAEDFWRILKPNNHSCPQLKVSQERKAIFRQLLRSTEKTEAIIFEKNNHMFFPMLAVQNIPTRVAYLKQMLSIFEKQRTSEDLETFQSHICKLGMLSPPHSTELLSLANNRERISKCFTDNGLMLSLESSDQPTSPSTELTMPGVSDISQENFKYFISEIMSHQTFQIQPSVTQEELHRLALLLKGLFHTHINETNHSISTTIPQAELFSIDAFQKIITFLESCTGTTFTYYSSFKNTQFIDRSRPL